MRPPAVRAAVVLVAAVTLLAAGCARIERGVYDAGLALARGLAGLEPGAVQVGERRIAYLERGAAQRAAGAAVVLVHGFGANKDVWTRFTRHLPEGPRVIAIDLPGHGDSSFEHDASHAPEALARSLAGTLDALGVQRAHLAGSSLGGLVVTRYALSRPERVASLALFDAAGVEPPRESDFQRALARGENPLLVDSPAGFDRLIAYVYHDPPPLPWPVRPVLVRTLVERAPVHERIWNDVIDNLRDLTPRLDALTMPTLVVWGERDRILDVSIVQVYERHVPDVRSVIIEDCGHSPMTERPRASARHYAAFLEAVPGSPAP